MTIDEAIARIDRIISSFDNDMLRIIEEVSINAQTLIIHRIQTSGIGEEYSNKKGVPAYLYLLDEERLDTEKTKAFVKKRAKSKDPEERFVNWSDIREAHGNQVEFVDLTFTGRMFQNVGVIITEKRGNQYVTTIAGFDEETRKKMQWNAKRYGNFFSSSKNEVTMLENLMQKRVVELTKKYLLL